MLKPFLKWTGGKSRSLNVLLPYVLSIFDDTKHLYVETFLGGGAVALALQPSRAILNDVNPNLMASYWCLKYHAGLLASQLKELEETYHNLTLEGQAELFVSYRERYNHIKLSQCTDLSRQNTEFLLDLACCFIFLNKTSFNGIYRENTSGKYNVPFGKYKTIHLYSDNLLQVAHYLQQPGITLTNQSFEDVLISTPTDTAIYYFDPPYLECDESKFNAYQAQRFTPQQHQTLLAFMEDHPSICSNAKSKRLTDQLPSSLRFTTLAISRCISSRQSTRRKQDEILIYPSTLQKRLDILRDKVDVYCQGAANFSSREEELCFLRQPLLAVLCRKQLGSVNTGVLSEYMVHHACQRNRIPIEKPAMLRCRVKPDWKITLGDHSFYLEIKSRSYTCTGTASEKLDSIPRKYAKVFAETGLRTLVIFTAKQASEKNALELLHPTTEYCQQFLQTSQTFGIEGWLTYQDFLTKIKIDS